MNINNCEECNFLCREKTWEQKDIEYLKIIFINSLRIMYIVFWSYSKVSLIFCWNVKHFYAHWQMRGPIAQSSILWYFCQYLFSILNYYNKNHIFLDSLISLFFSFLSQGLTVQSWLTFNSQRFAYLHLESIYICL